MPTPRVAMRKIKECLRLKLECDLSHERIALALGLSKGVVSKYVKRATAAGLDWPGLSAMDDNAIAAQLCMSPPAVRGERAPIDLPWVHRELRRKGVTRQLLWQEYCDANAGRLTYQYTQFCQHLHDYTASLRRSMRQLHVAGEKLFIDYAGPTLGVVNPDTGELQRAHIFVAVLGASSFTYACATPGETQIDWLRGLTQALAFFGGVPALVVPDNPRALITQPDRYEPVLNRATQACAEHYGMAILPARPRRPQDKAKVEVGVQVVERWILARLRHPCFFTFSALNHAIADLLTDLNARPFKKLDGSRRSWFETIDRPALMPLPAQPYEPARFKPCKVNIDYHIEVDGHYYSVPHSLVRKTVEARITDTTVEILHAGQRIASHVRSPARGRHTTVADHMPAAHRAHREWSPGRFLHWADTIGAATRQLVEHLLTERPHPEMGYRSCLGLLALARQYGDDRLEAACARAWAIGSRTRKSVQSILHNKLDQHPLPSAIAQTDWVTPDHVNLRGPTYYRDPPTTH
ncbi:IS21 family transposase [Dyella sp. M7H15-1]|uniref:IS21 family transposase n=1 Tax=Dyella sp. M7H15-1 TaxID=2501295 RepID=UPI001004F191|nr:IS21 family transposase [Dyella sp. M7H15-1]QAU23073.1 IS21 family transposase [Dyella sp. M7H15-1]QAU24342.1 IS21 family transposase [Dyella sp. M7H15-1]